VYAVGAHPDEARRAYAAADARRARRPSVSSASAPWLGLPFELHRMRSTPSREGVEAGPVAGDFGVLVLLDGEVDIVSRDGHRLMHNVGRAGSVAILSGDTLQRYHTIGILLKKPAIPPYLQKGVSVFRWIRSIFSSLIIFINLAI